LHNLRSSPHKDLLEWRRNQVLELSAQGLNQIEISKKLKVDQSQISRDIRFLRELAKKNVELHIQEKLPEEFQKCITGLNQVLKKSWEIAISAGDEKTKIQALQLANECYKYRMDLMTNGAVITDALKFVEKNNSVDSKLDKAITGEHRMGK
jgi:DNA-binding transcriptional regulator LsrR (DeoR family)